MAMAVRGNGPPAVELRIQPRTQFGVDLGPHSSTNLQAALQQQLLAALPQTQCTRCGYPDCAAYATAISSGDAEINQCPPGGADGVARLAAITGRPALPLLPLNPANGLEGPRSVAWIDENWCIGCTLCLDACPTDAIVGSNKMMHTVIEPHCTGCELCLPVCPVDCIVMENASGSATGWAAWSPALAENAQNRYAKRNLRNSAEKRELAKKQLESLEHAAADLAGHSKITDPAELDKKRAVVQAALARARARRGA